MDGETIDFLAKEAGVEDRVAKITHEAMSGRLDFFESLKTRVGLLEGLELKKAKDICENLPFMFGAKECISELKQRDMKVVIFSGGFSLATHHAKNILGVDGEFSNELHHKNGKLTGLVGGHMMFSHSKGVMIQRLQQLLGIKQSETMSIGDGANDLSMFKYSGLKVSFCAKEILQKEADIKIETKDLMQIIKHI